MELIYRNPLRRWYQKQPHGPGGLSQAQLAREIGMDRGVLGLMLREGYSSFPPLDLAMKIEKRTGVTPQAFYAFIRHSREERA